MFSDADLHDGDSPVGLIFIALIVILFFPAIKLCRKVISAFESPFPHEEHYKFEDEFG